MVLNVTAGRYRAELPDPLDSRFATFEAQMDRWESRLGTKLDELETALVRWMFLLWLATMAIVAALIKL